MRLLLTFLLFTAFLISDTFTVASYNVENLFDMERNGHEYPEYLPNQHNWNQRTLQQKLTNISEVICDLNADMIGLQEIENQNALKLLQKSLRDYGCYYPHYAISQTKQSAIQVALLSKIPIQSSQDIIVSRVGGVRDILEVKVTITNNPLYLYINHWNSKRSPESKRMRSAKALVNRLRSLPHSTEYILLGDFNSDYNEYLTIEPQHNDTTGKTGINHILETIAEDQALVHECAISSSNHQHYNLWLELPIYQRWSHNFYGNKQGLDAIVIPSSMMDGKGIDYLNDSFTVFKKSYLFHTKGYIYRWEYRKKRHTRKGYSDHLPVMASFSTQPYQRANCTISNTTIEQLTHQVTLSFPLRLQQVDVVKSEKNKVTLQDQSGKDIEVFGIDMPLHLHHRYDLIVYQRNYYQDRYEIVDYSIEKSYD